MLMVATVLIEWPCLRWIPWSLSLASDTKKCEFSFEQGCLLVPLLQALSELPCRNTPFLEIT